MKLIAEQVKYLREKRDSLEAAKRNYLKSCARREGVSYEGIGRLVYSDFNDEAMHFNTTKELDEISSSLRKAQFVTERNYELVDIGTSVTVCFDDEDDDLDTFLLVDENTYNGGGVFASIGSDLGKAIYGKKKGDTCTYKVGATGRQITVSIADIDNVRDHYEHFIREKNQSERISKIAKKELRELKENNYDEYLKRQEITASQLYLVEEELAKIKDTDLSSVRRKSYLNKILHMPVAEPPMDDTIGIGSKVSLLLQDENGDLEEKKFELINHAVSTELESHYVERISTLGRSIYGLKEKDTFKVLRPHMPSLKGIVAGVDNSYNIEKSY